MLCAKCQKKEAVEHFTICGPDGDMECIDLCEECAPSASFEHVTVGQLKSFSALGKKCAFCGGAAVSGQITGNSTIYWCSDCGAEFAEILTQKVKTVRPDLVTGEDSCTAYFIDAETQAWATNITQEAVRILKTKRRKIE